MRAILAALCAALLISNSVLACDKIPISSTDGPITRLIDEHHGIPLSKAKNDELCEQLEARHASLLLVGGSGIVKGKAIAWINIGVRDQTLGIATFAYGANATNISDNTSQKGVDDLLINLLSSTIEATPFDQLLQELDARRTEIQTSYSAPASALSSTPNLAPKGDCQTSTPEVVSSPRLDLIWAATNGLKPSKDHLFSGTPTPTDEYRTFAKVLIEVASDGVPTAVRMPLGQGDFASTGNRKVDRAIQSWGMQLRFNPANCAGDQIRRVAIPIDLRR